MNWQVLKINSNGLALSLFLILFDSFLFEKKTKWIEKLNLFDDDK